MSVSWGGTDIETTATTHFKITHMPKKKSEEILNKILNWIFQSKKKRFGIKFFLIPNLLVVAQALLRKYAEL